MIIYIHVCQKGEWRRSWLMLMNQIKDSGLYDECEQIRCGVVSDEGYIIPDDLFADYKVSIIHSGHSSEHERPTLLHMQKASVNNESDMFLYCHTKGIRWYGTSKEANVVDWIKLLIYWNITLWKNAVDALKSYDTYGCNITTCNGKFPQHYSGNFFWATNVYLKKLSPSIGLGYNDPEFWPCSANPKCLNAFSSGLEGCGHYNNPFPEEKYIIKELQK